MLRFVAAAVVLASCGPVSPVTEVPDAPPRGPVARVEPHALTAHGQTRDDPYYWMRDDDRDDPEILQHLEAENAYTQTRMAPYATFRGALYDEIIARIQPDESSVPYRMDGYYYYVRYEEGREYPIYARRVDRPEAPEEIMLDANANAVGHDYYQVRGAAVSSGNDVFAYTEDTVGRRIYTIRFRNLRTGEMLPDVIPGVAESIVWATDNRTLFYIKKEEGTLREYQVWRHALGTDPTTDVLVYEEADPEFWVEIRRTKTKRFIIIASYQTQSHEMRVIPAGHPTGEPLLFLPREERHEYDIEDFGGACEGSGRRLVCEPIRFYIRTNWEARDFRLMSADLEHRSDKSAWRVEIPARDGVFLRSFDVFQDYLVAAERQNGIAGLRVIPWASRDASYVIPFDEAVYVADFETNVDINSSVLRLSYSSLTTPDSVIDFDMSARTRTLMKQEQVLGGFNRDDYVSERVVATARDGTQVPISLVYRRSLDRSSPQPLFLYGYGAYGYSTDPEFSSSRLSLLNRGVIFAIAHVRGGQEFGRRWYEEGKLLNKRNTFTDFIDCAQHLVRDGYTSPDRLFAYGASAGGLLTGAVANMRPDLFAAIVADVPFVDVVTTMLDETIPLTTFEYDEWGNPNEREYFEYMMSYSPYDNVSAQNYPHMLVLAGLHDSQVQYWEPMKWVARLRATKTDDHDLLLYTNMDAGHSGPSGRFRRHEETAMIYAFVLSRIGILN